MSISLTRYQWILLAAACILSLPAILMPFTEQVNWGVMDFIVGGILLFGTGTLVEFALRSRLSARSKMALAAVLILGLLLIWAELAVGLFGTFFAGS